MKRKTATPTTIVEPLIEQRVDHPDAGPSKVLAVLNGGLMYEFQADNGARFHCRADEVTIPPEALSTALEAALRVNGVAGVVKPQPLPDLPPGGRTLFLMVVPPPRGRAAQ